MSTLSSSESASNDALYTHREPVFTLGPADDSLMVEPSLVLFREYGSELQELPDTLPRNGRSWILLAAAFPANLEEAGSYAWSAPEGGERLEIEALPARASLRITTSEDNGGLNFREWVDPNTGGAKITCSDGTTRIPTGTLVVHLAASESAETYALVLYDGKIGAVRRDGGRTEYLPAGAAGSGRGARLRITARPDADVGPATIRASFESGSTSLAVEHTFSVGALPAINRRVIDLATSVEAVHPGYDSPPYSSSGFPQTLEVPFTVPASNAWLFEASSAAGTYCTGFTLYVALKTIIDEDLAGVQEWAWWPPTAVSGIGFQQRANNATAESVTKGIAMAIPWAGAGREVDRDEARSGDFVQIGHTGTGGGHSAVFLGWVFDDEVPTKRVALRFRSTQSSTNGIGDETWALAGSGLDLPGPSVTATYLARLEHAGGSTEPEAVSGPVVGA